MAEKKNNNDVRKDRFTWGAGDVEIILPNGKKLKPKKAPKNQTKKK